MESLRVERLDHFGLIASVLKDVRLIERIDACLMPDEPEALTPGQAWAGMILNGLGLTTRPLSLPPPFCAHKPLARLWRDGVHAGLCHRLKRGRTLEEVYAYGGARWWSALALASGIQAGLDPRCTHLDTTSFALSGDSVPDRDEPAMPLTPGDAKDHRPDVTPAVWALRVSQEGGGPLVSPSGEGHAADTQRFQERAAAWMAPLPRAPLPRSVVADSPWSQAEQAAHLRPRGWIPRMPHTLQLVAPVVTPALTGDPWQRLHDTTRSHRLAWWHDGMAQRGLVVSSQAAVERAAATGRPARQRASDALETPLLHLHAQRCATPEGAHAALAMLAHPWPSPQVAAATLSAPQHEVGPGRPSPTPPVASMAGQMHAQGRPDQPKMADRTPHTACLVVGTKMAASQRRDRAGRGADQGPAQAAGGWRFLQDPRCFVASWFVNKPCRIPGLWLVLSCAWLVYAVTPRRLRHPWAPQGETVPNQSNQPTARPPWRWVFQLLAGIHRVRVTVQGQGHDLIAGLHEGQIKILRWFGDEVCRL